MFRDVVLGFRCHSRRRRGYRFCRPRFATTLLPFIEHHAHVFGNELTSLDFRCLWRNAVCLSWNRCASIGGRQVNMGRKSRRPRPKSRKKQAIKARAGLPSHPAENEDGDSSEDEAAQPGTSQSASRTVAHWRFGMLLDEKHGLLTKHLQVRPARARARARARTRARASFL